MPAQKPFIQQLLKRLDRIDRESLHQYVTNLSAENELLKESFQRLREGVLLVNEEGTILLLNQQAAGWLGVSPASASPPHLKLSQLGDTTLSHHLRSKLPLHAEYGVEDVHLLNPREVYLRVFIIPLQEAGASVSLVLLEDRTHETAEQVTIARISRIEALIRLAAGVAHEIGNPLNILFIHLQLLHKQLDKVPETYRKPLEKGLQVLQTETVRLDRIIKNFIRATRKPPLRFRPENMNQILDEALALMEPHLINANIRITLKKDLRLPPFLLDKDRLHQILINLIKNAAESMPKSGQLSIQTQRKGKTAIFRIQDSGEGIDAKDLPHIFDAYYTTKAEGSGLGLMTVYNSVTEHGGKIDVESQKGKGTTFTVTLPIRAAALQLPKYDLDPKK